MILNIRAAQACQTTSQKWREDLLKLSQACWKESLVESACRIEVASANGCGPEMVYGPEKSEREPWT